MSEPSEARQRALAREAERERLRDERKQEAERMSRTCSREGVDSDTVAAFCLELRRLDHVMEKERLLAQAPARSSASGSCVFTAAATVLALCSTPAPRRTMQASAAAASNAAVAASASIATPAPSPGADNATFEESLPLR